MVERSTLRKNVFIDVYGLLNTISDPLTRNKQWIFSSNPQFDAITFVGFPILVVNRAQVRKRFSRVQDDNPDNYVTITINVMAKDSKMLDELSDSVDDVVNPTNLNNYRFVDYSESNNDILINAETVHIRSMSYLLDVMKYVDTSDD